LFIEYHHIFCTIEPTAISVFRRHQGLPIQPPGFQCCGNDYTVLQMNGRRKCSGSLDLVHLPKRAVAARSGFSRRPNRRCVNIGNGGGGNQLDGAATSKCTGYTLVPQIR